MNKSSFFIVGQHAVIEALKNPKRKVLKVFLTEESKKNIHRKHPNKNILSDIKIYYKVLSGSDSDTFDNKLWTIMSQETPAKLFSEDDETFHEFKYVPAGQLTTPQKTITYPPGSGIVQYKTFDTFAIKIVMISSNTSKVPRLRDLRVIAFAP